MHVIKNNGIIQRIVYESIGKKIGICGYDRAAVALEKILCALDVAVAYFLILNDVEQDDYEEQRVIYAYDLVYELDDIFIVEPHFDRIFIKYKNVLSDLGYVEWKDFVHIFSGAVHENVIVKHTDCIDINLGVLWSQDENGFTVYGSNESKAYTIVTLGGSTTYADQLIYSKCWSELLYQKFLRNGKKKVKILCGGAPAFDSTQELIKFLRDVVPMKPDMVISYSGINDVVDSHGDYNDYGPGYPFAFPRLSQRMKEYIRDTGEKRKLYLGRKNQQSVEDIWILNKKIMHYVADEVGIQFYTFLQPMLFYRNYHIDNELAPKLNEYKKSDRFRQMFENAKDFCEKIAKKAEDAEYIIDFTNIFDGCSKLFIDYAHVNQWGNEIIAQKIYEYIENRIK